jgi:uncharacterized membrane protein YraQ (UPF0718 family)
MINAIIRQYFMHKEISTLSGYKFIDVSLAAVIGIISPIPTYIAVPLGVSFLYTGISFSAVIAFMIASPLMNPGIFYLTFSRLGPEIAIARVVAAALLAIGGGYLISWIFRKPIYQLSKSYKKYKVQQERSIWLEAWRSLRFFSRYFLIALFLSAAVKSFISPEFITRLLGGNASMSLIAAISLGVPFYNCGGAAIPLVEVLSEMGMNKGAVLAFFISGPSTKLETLYIYKSVFQGYAVILFYLSITLLGAFICGLVFFFL